MRRYDQTAQFPQSTFLREHGSGPLPQPDLGVHYQNSDAMDEFTHCPWQNHGWLVCYKRHDPVPYLIYDDRHKW